MDPELRNAAVTFQFVLALIGVLREHQGFEAVPAHRALHPGPAADVAGANSGDRQRLQQVAGNNVLVGHHGSVGRHNLLLRIRYAPCVHPHEGKFGEAMQAKNLWNSWYSRIFRGHSVTPDGARHDRNLA